MLRNVGCLVTQSTWRKIPEDSNSHVTRPLTKNIYSITTFIFCTNMQIDRQNMFKERLGDRNLQQEGMR